MNFLPGLRQGPKGIRKLDVEFDAMREHLFALEAVRARTGKSVVVALASRAAKEGVTTSALGLVRAIARTGTLRVLLIDYDPGRKGVAARLGIGARIANGAGPLKGDVLDAGAFQILTLDSALPSGFDGDQQWSTMFGVLIDGYDFVVVDTGSMAKPIAARWGRIAGLFAVVVDTTRTTEEELQRMRSEFDTVDQHIGAVILSKRRYRVPGFLYRLLR